MLQIMIYVTKLKFKFMYFKTRHENEQMILLFFVWNI